MGKRTISNDFYSQLLNELAELQIQITSAKPSNLSQLLDRQIYIHNIISKRLYKLANEQKIIPQEGLQSIVRPPYVVTFQLIHKGCAVVHSVSYCCEL